tara:strand:+ start:1879 stop:2646 length:768 start_codon:yes stop_codon:yes gene_type:complete
MSNDGRHRLSYIIATLGPSTDNEKELITMLMAGIARQWIEGVDIARVLHSDGEETAKNRIEIFRGQSTKRNLTTRIYLDTDQESSNTEEYIAFSNSVKPDIVTFPKSLGLDFFRSLSTKIQSDSKICVRFLKTDSVDDADDYFEVCDFAMIETDSKIIVDENVVERAKTKQCEPIYLALMPTLMTGQVQSREENFEIGHTLEAGFDYVALYQETSHGPYAARSVKCVDEITVESEKLRVNPFSDFMDKILGFFKK